MCICVPCFLRSSVLVWSYAVFARSETTEVKNEVFRCSRVRRVTGASLKSFGGEWERAAGGE